MENGENMRIACVKINKIKLFILLLLGVLCISFGSYGMKEYAAQVDISTKKLPIYCTDNDKREISLTINCAWGADDIDEILDILDRYNVKATFFVLGIWAEANPEKLLEMYYRGHEIGNHSYSHKLPSKSTAEQLNGEIEKCNQVVEDIIGVKPILYRAPSGDNTETVLELAEGKGMYNIKWSVDSIDWRENMTSENILNRVLGRIEPGGIMLFHNDTKYICKVLPTIIETLQKQEYKFVKVSELIYMEDYYIDNTGKQIKNLK